MERDDQNDLCKNKDVRGRGGRIRELKEEANDQKIDKNKIITNSKI